MLDYILSKIVMLIFLFATLLAFVAVKSSLSGYFLQSAASQQAKLIVARVVGLVSNTISVSSAFVYALPPYIQGGNKRIPFKVVAQCANQSGSVLLGIGISTEDNHVIGFSTTDLRNPFGGKISVKICGFSSGGSGSVVVGDTLKYKYVRIAKDLSGSDLSITICPADNTGTSCISGAICNKECSS